MIESKTKLKPLSTIEEGDVMIYINTKFLNITKFQIIRKVNMQYVGPAYFGKKQHAGYIFNTVIDVYENELDNVEKVLPYETKNTQSLFEYPIPLCSDMMITSVENHSVNAFILDDLDTSKQHIEKMYEKLGKDFKGNYEESLETLKCIYEKFVKH